MKIVIATDSFKESLAARDVANAIAAGVRDVLPKAEVICLPMADGGEGTLDAVLQATGGERRHRVVQDAIGQPRRADWGWLDTGTAIIEMASAAGLEHVAIEDRNPGMADTFGVGELIKDALDAGAKRVVLTAGGSATNDGGAGMLRALGLRMLDASGKPLAPGGLPLASLDHIDAHGLDPRIKAVEFTIATDVSNPLCGAEGASAIFGPQKGATPEMVLALDGALARFAQATQEVLGEDLRDKAGAGAAGGLGFGAMAWLGAEMRRGAMLVAEIVGLAQAMRGADLIFTGEGKLDAQTLLGKTPLAVIELAQAAGLPVIGLAGSLGTGYQALHAAGLTAAFSLTDGPISLARACQDAPALLRDRSAQIMRIWLAASARSARH